MAVLSIPIKMDVCVCVCVYMSGHNSGTTGAISNLVHILLYVCVRVLCMFYVYSAGKMVWEAGNLDGSHC
jgi:hypothetical protein